MAKSIISMMVVKRRFSDFIISPFIYIFVYLFIVVWTHLILILSCKSSVMSIIHFHEVISNFPCKSHFKLASLSFRHIFVILFSIFSSYITRFILYFLYRLSRLDRLSKEPQLLVGSYSVQQLIFKS